MEEKKPRMAGSKVSQIANIFQSMVPAKETEALSSSVTIKSKPVKGSGDGPADRDASPPSQITVVRTESHVARFNNARALFEKLGADKSTPSGPPPTVQRIPTSSQPPSIRSDTSPTSATSPLRNRISRSPSQERPLSDIIPISVSCPPPSVTGYRKTEKASEGPSKCIRNGLQTNGLSDDSKSVQGVSSSYESSSRVPYVKGGKVRENVCVNGSGSKEELNDGGGSDRESVAKEGHFSQSSSPEPRKPGKPEKPERKFNSRELIEKQKNWTSHFSKSRTSRHSSEPNRSEVKASLAGSSANLESPSRSSQWSPDSLATSVSPASRSASFNTSRVAVSTSSLQESTEYSRSPSRSPNTPEEKQEKELQEKTIDHLHYPPSSSYAREEKCRTTDGSRESSYSSGRSCRAQVVGVIPHARSDQASHLAADRSPTDETQNKGKKVVSSAQLTLQGAEVTPSRSEEASSLSDNFQVAVKAASDSDDFLYRRDNYLENRLFTGQDESGLHSEFKTEPNAETSLTSKGKSETATDSNAFPLRSQSDSQNSCTNTCSTVDSRYRVNRRSDVDNRISPRTVLESPVDSSSEMDIVKPCVDVDSMDCSPSNLTSGSTFIIASPEDNLIISPDEAFADASRASGDSEPASVVAVRPPPCPDLLEGTKNQDSLLCGSLTGASSEGSILDLQDVEYADADAEDSDEHEESCESKPLLPQTIPESSDCQTADSEKKVNAIRTISKTADYLVNTLHSAPDTMTPDEAENLLSTSILEKKLRQEGLLSDEEAQEITQLLSPTEEKARNEPQWFSDVTSVTGASRDESPEYRVKSETSETNEDSLSSSQIESKSGSESGLLGSTNSLDEQDHIDSTTRLKDFVPVPGKVVVVENGVHYFEDGHFWMEVPGLPESDDDDSDYPIPVKKNTKVSFSTGPIKVYSTFSVNDYDRRNEDVDPVAASAEYELEKRVEKMDVFPVELTKGPEGLGLSIIGMGVGADAGLEKLGIFVKTITENGAAARDGRIQVNDQIIEVDGRSLVGVTQAYAASVLRNTCGLVKFLIGREKDPQNSEVAQLIKQSLQADREREEQRRQMEQRVRSGAAESSCSEDSSITSPTVSLTAEGPPVSPGGAADSVFDLEAPRSPSATNDVDALRLLLQESQLKLAIADNDVARLKSLLVELEQNGADNEEYLERLRLSTARLKETETNLIAAKKDVANYQDMLEQSQAQYAALEKKYCKAKKLLREFQQREQDLIHREEFYLQLLQEKDTEYNALVKSLKDRVIQLEQELLETQQRAGLPPVLPYDNTSLKQLTPQPLRRQQAPPVKPLLQQLEAELSDTEISDISPEDGDKTATVERKMPVKEELDRAVPPHELLDVSASKAKAELATRGGLAGRQLPSGKKSGGLSNSSSEYGLDESCDNSDEEEDNTNEKPKNMEYIKGDENRNEINTSIVKSQEYHQQSSSLPANSTSPISTCNVVTSSTLTTMSSSATTVTTSHVHSLVSQFSSAQQLQQKQRQQSSSAHPVTHHTGLIAKSHSHFVSSTPTPSTHPTNNISTLYTPAPQPSHVHPHHITPPMAVSPIGANAQLQPSPDPWATCPQRKAQAPTFAIGPPLGLAAPPASLAEQLKQVLAERERRISGGDASRETSGSFNDTNKAMTQSLAEEIRQAVNEANAKVKKAPISQTLTPPHGGNVWQQQNAEPPSPSSLSSSGSVSPAVGTADPSPSKLGAGQKGTSHFWQSAPVTEWSKEQVCQWLLALSLEQHIPKFLEQQIGGPALLQLESRDLKQLGVVGEDKNRLKRKLKELRVQVEKERRQLEKERKEKERLQRKAEKLAEKAERGSVLQKISKMAANS
ncbi:hypothetical protein R5R35_001290 [Gryllus longicercus]|uniref:Neurabin-1 n=1 Tax=Gryllus longicercus TaxID=2509291 RepID=A0AAN9VP58_9ORTH